MATYITKDGLVDVLTRFRERGDERWASKSEAISEQRVLELIDELGIDVSELTQYEIEEVLASM